MFTSHRRFFYFCVSDALGFRVQLSRSPLGYGMGLCGLCFFCLLCVRTLFRTLLFLLPRRRFDTDTSLLYSSPHTLLGGCWKLELDNHFSSTVVASRWPFQKLHLFAALSPVWWVPPITFRSVSFAY